LRVALFRFVAVIVVAALGMVGTAIAVAPRALDLVTSNHGTAEPLELAPLVERSLMFDRNGGVMATMHAEQNRSPVALDAVPDHVIDAILAVEDENFYEHDGVNLRATFRALFANVASGRVEQGGSTITMQVVKQSLLTPEQNLTRKAQEAVLARRLEDEMSKDDILERYVNTVYVGNGAYGFQAGAEIYFGVAVGDLDLGQAALLVALIRNPNGYDPFRFPELALERRNLVLDRLVDVGIVPAAEADELAFQPLPREPPAPVTLPVLDYFAEEVKLALLREPSFGLGDTPDQRRNAVFGGGLRIFTTFDPVMQQHALDARAAVLPGEDGTFTVRGQLALSGEEVRDHTGTAAIVSVEPDSGAIRAMVGGPGFDRFRVNIATFKDDNGVGGRQTGSAFKIFVLLALLENGYVPNDTVNGSGPCSFDNPGGVPDPYRAENFANSGGGSASITQQTLRSSNCAYLRLGQVVGLDKVIEVAERLGVSTDLKPNLSLPLGVESILPLEMAAASAALANDGIYNPPYYVDRIEDRAGNVLYEHRSEGERAVSQQSARLATEVLRQNVQSGTGTRARVAGQPAAGKTGTAQNSADAWFVGFTPQLATAVWIGVPEGQVPLRNVGGITVTGGSYPASIWGQFMTAALQGVPTAEFEAADRARSGRSLRAPGERATRSSSSGGPSSGGSSSDGPSDDGATASTVPAGAAPGPSVPSTPVPGGDPPGAPPSSAPPSAPPTTAAPRPRDPSPPGDDD